MSLIRLSIYALVIILITGLLFIIGRFFLAPYVLQISDNFEYTADLLSFDNFFDEEAQRFTGETRSVTTFSYRGQEEKNGSIEIQNIFDIRTVTGKEIITIERSYGIEKLEWKHNPKLGERPRAGYLFGPRHLRPGDTFLYWHVSYDQALLMKFDGEEVIAGVPVHRYVTDVVVDQTDDLTHLPDVPNKRGINLDVSLKMWVEPNSGWLVKYEDSAIAFYYDKQTGQRLHPWNKFRNTYTRGSIIEQAEFAQNLKVKLFLLEIVTPSLFGILAIFFLLWRARKLRDALIFLAIALILMGAFSLYKLRTVESTDLVLVGIAKWVSSSNPAYEENIQGFKDALSQVGFQEGKDIEYILEEAAGKEEVQREIARSFARQNVDLVYSLTTPGTLILKEAIPNRPIVFSIVTYPEEAGLIASEQSSGNNLVGSRNWVSVKEQLEVFLEIVPTVSQIGFVHRLGEPNSTIQLQEMVDATKGTNIEIREIAALDEQGLIEALFATQNEIDSVYSACDTLVQGSAEEAIISFVKKNNLPSFSCNVSGPQKGDLVGVVADSYDIGFIAGEKAALILNGASPSSLRTNTVQVADIYINRIRAEELGIRIPQSILARATKIISE